METKISQYETPEVWLCPNKGLKKVLIERKLTSMKKPTEISKCLVIITEPQGILNRETNFIKDNTEFYLELGTSKTPIDYYIELFLQEMFEGETSKCFIKTKDSTEISFIINLIKIDYNSYLYQLTPKEIFDLASKYKENGVIMFKKNALIANEYFNRAAKCLISFKPFNVLSISIDNVDPIEMEHLLNILNTNISACHLKQDRFEDVIYLTQFVEDVNNASEKAIYRRALALYNLKKYDEAKELIENSQYKNKSEFLTLINKILNDSKIANDNYKNVVKKMFG